MWPAGSRLMAQTILLLIRVVNRGTLLSRNLLFVAVLSRVAINLQHEVEGINLPRFRGLWVDF
jgi:hypothetical protein